MVTLIQDGIEVSADNVAAAKRQLTKSVKAARAAAAVELASERMANKLAAAQGFQMLVRVAKGEPMPRAWTFSTSSDHSDFKPLAVDDGGYRQYRATQYGTDGPICGTMGMFASDRVLGVISGSYGVIAIAVEWMNGTTEILAIGVYGGLARWEVVPGITIDMFTPSRF